MILSCKNMDHGVITDSRDGTKYHWIKIGDQKWFTENLAYLPSVNKVSEQSDSEPMYYVYGNIESDNPDTARHNKVELVSGEEINTYNEFGVLYNFAVISNDVGVCPTGWRIPTDDDWKELEIHLGMDKHAVGMLGHRPEGGLGHRLKDSVGWANDGNGLNEVQLAIKSTGECFSGSNFHSEGSTAVFWTATKDNFGNGMVRKFSCCKEGIIREWKDQRDGYSIRCIQ